MEEDWKISLTFIRQIWFISIPTLILRCNLLRAKRVERSVSYLGNFISVLSSCSVAEFARRDVAKLHFNLHAETKPLNVALGGGFKTYLTNFPSAPGPSGRRILLEMSWHSYRKQSSCNFIAARRKKMGNGGNNILEIFYEMTLHPAFEQDLFNFRLAIILCTTNSF